jgi:Na+-translocating ferredoxin:NAD+ oxidoreductase RnfD subunit
MGATIGDPSSVAKIIVAVTIFALVSAGAMFTVFFALGEPIAGWLAFSTFVVYASGFGIFAFAGSVKPAIRLVVWFGLVSVLCIHVTLGATPGPAHSCSGGSPTV